MLKVEPCQSLYNFCLVAAFTIYHLGAVWRIASLELIRALYGMIVADLITHATAMPQFERVTKRKACVMSTIGAEAWEWHREAPVRGKVTLGDTKGGRALMITTTAICTADNLAYDFVLHFVN